MNSCKKKRKSCQMFAIFDGFRVCVNSEDPFKKKTVTIELLFERKAQYNSNRFVFVNFCFYHFL